jgi:predicted DNA-binding transcriptional regulator YafY
MACVLETSGRLLKLLSLLQAHRDWTGPELAERLGITVRTVRRDVDKLRNLGYPVEATLGVAGGYRLGAGASLPPLLLDDDEAVAVAVGLRTAAGGTVTGIAETSVRALAKLEQVLPSRLRYRVRSVQSMTVPLTGSGPVVDPEVLAVLAGACRDHQRLRLVYTSGDGTTSRRVCEPHRLVHTGRRWYLVAWDNDRADWRTFRVDRLRVRDTPGPRFAARELSDAEVAELTSHSVSTGGYRYQGRFTFHASAEEVRRVVTPTSVRVEPVDEHSCTVHAGANDLDLLGVWVALLGFEFEIHEPRELAESLNGVIDRLLRATGRISE